MFCCIIAVQIILFDSNSYIISVMVLNCSCGREVMLLVELNDAMIVIVRISCLAGETVCLLQDNGYRDHEAGCLTDQLGRMLERFLIR